MGWIRVTPQAGQALHPILAQLNRDADALDRLSDSYIPHGAKHPRTAEELREIDERGL